ncbi:STT3 domain-containing protein [Halorubellus litoreus]|uniref:dolichyl-phosphooligosaccharide-protein glycotransferase n=1 Tax=Halorubellus litoreus TaxID=755308 RepID=A0ABD5VC72_9EURY
MNEVRERTEAFLEDRDDAEGDLRAVLAVDAETETWAFDDVPVDSGRFGELVSRGIVEDAGDGYCLSDPDAVRGVLDGDVDGVDATDGAFELPSITGRVGREEAVSVVLAVTSVVLMRLVAFQSVFREGLVVLLGNDPYLYRYWTERVTANASGPFDAAFGTSMGAMADGEPLLVAMLSWWTSVLGGASAAGGVLAWYPVVAAVVVASLLYVAVRLLTSDRRVALAAIVILAVTPEHALRTAVGFADHHAFDYVWLGTTLVGVLLAERASGGRTAEDIVAAGLIAVGVTGQVLAWEAGPLLAVPVGLYAVVRAVRSVRTENDPVQSLMPVIAGTAGAGAMTFAAHATFGWHSTVVAATPALLFAGVVAVAGVAAVCQRYDRSPREVLAVEVVAGVVVTAVAVVTIPGLEAALAPRLAFLLSSPDIAESKSLFSPAAGSLFGPVLAFGLAFFVGLPYLTWVTATVARGSNATWTAPVVYAWWFLALAIIQVRFAGELAAFLAIFTGVGFVHLASVVDITPTRPAVLDADAAEEAAWRPSLPARSTVVSIAVLFVLVGGLGAVQTPLQVSKVTVDDGTVEAVQAADSVAESHDRRYPENYVFSRWGYNRLYNYFVNGESRSYAYARSEYQAFLSASDGKAWYNKLRRDSRAGFVVTEDLQNANLSDDSLHARLHGHWGSASNSSTGLSHYRAIYASPDASLKLFEVVPGATIIAPAPDDAPVTASTTVDVSGHEVTYERTVEPFAAGVVRLTVPYASTYEVGDRTVSIDPTAIRDSERYDLFDGSGAVWAFENGTGDVAYETENGNHGVLRGGTWTTTDASGTGISLRPSQTVQAPNATVGVDTAESFALTVEFKTNASTDYENDIKYPRLALHGPVTSYRETDGYQLAMAEGRLVAAIGDGEDAVVLTGPRVDDQQFHDATLRRDGEAVELLLDGDVVDTATWRGSLDVDGDAFTIGRGFHGTMTAVSVDTTNGSSRNMTVSSAARGACITGNELRNAFDFERSPPAPEAAQPTRYKSLYGIVSD